MDYYFFVPQILPEKIYQYFPDEPTKGGPRSADFCPVYGSVYDNYKSEQLDCRDPDNAPSINVYRYVFFLRFCIYFLKETRHTNVKC